MGLVGLLVHCGVNCLFLSAICLRPNDVKLLFIVGQCYLDALLFALRYLMFHGGLCSVLYDVREQPCEHGMIMFVVQ
jgi:hypothetical protein